MFAEKHLTVYMIPNAVFFFFLWYFLRFQRAVWVDVAAKSVSTEQAASERETFALTSARVRHDCEKLLCSTRGAVFTSAVSQAS